MMEMRRRVYLAAGYNTVSMGTGRKEFHPEKPRPELEDYIKEVGQNILQKIGGADNVDECVIGNFMAERYNKQGNLAGFFPMIDKGLTFKPCIRVEGACGTGGLALVTAIKSILAGLADVVLVIGVEVQNVMKAVYGADVLAGAGWFKERKEAHAYYFPGKFSDRAGKYYEKYGKEKTRRAMARWYRNAIENARLCPTAQEFHNTTENLEELAMIPPNPKTFVEHLTIYDCSKVSDAACGIIVASREGLRRCNIDIEDSVEVIGFGQAEYDITKPPADLTRLETTEVAIDKALDMADISINEIATVECHDCFSIAGILSVEAIGFARYGEGADFVLDGETSREGKVPFNTTGGLIGWGHPVGATGVHQAVTIWEQLTGKAGDAQIHIPFLKPYGLSINMGGDDKTVTVIVYRQTY